MIGRYSVYRSPIYFLKNDDDNGDDKRKKKKPNQAQDFKILPFEVFFPPNLEK